jgi:CDP-diacylglycerol---serine O-phosphatidyltransferase
MSKNLSNNKVKYLSIVKLFPNIVTIAAICFGLSSVKYAFEEKWELAVILIVIAGFLDVVDGRLARLLKATSDFGAYLDSLADFINFGVAPAIVLYLWELRYVENKSFAWALVLFFAICVAIRLARFNSDLGDENHQEWQDGFFKGVPAPLGAYLALIPMMLNFRFDINIQSYTGLLFIYLILIAGLLVSKLPTFSTKKAVIRREYVPQFFMGFGLIIAFLIIEPWIVFPVFGVLYVLSIPFSYKKYKQNIAQN